MFHFYYLLFSGTLIFRPTNIQDDLEKYQKIVGSIHSTQIFVDSIHRSKKYHQSSNKFR